MPDEVYGQCQELVNESVNQIRALLDEAMVPGDFTIFDRAKAQIAESPTASQKTRPHVGQRRLRVKMRLSSRQNEEKDALRKINPNCPDGKRWKH
jgi:hypothetical protein